MSYRRTGASVLLALHLVTARATAAEPISETKVRCSASYEQAQTLRRDERLAAARSQLVICQETCPSSLASDCKRWLAEVDALMPTVRLKVYRADGKALDGLRVSIDGRVVDAPLGASLTVSPGEHVFRFEGTDSEPAVVRVDVHSGERDHPVEVLLSGAKPVKGAASASKVPSLVVGSVGAALLVAAGGLAVKGYMDRSELRSTCAPFCDQEAIDSIRTIWWTAAGFAIGGGVALGVAIALFPKGKGGDAASLTVAPQSVALTIPML